MALDRFAAARVFIRNISICISIIALAPPAKVNAPRAVPSIKKQWASENGPSRARARARGREGANEDEMRMTLHFDEAPKGISDVLW